jgi:hypothetical protein
MWTDDDLFRPPAPKEFSRKLVAMLKIEDGGKVAGPYGKGYPRTDESFMRARHARPSYALRAGYPPNGLMAVLGVARLLSPWISLPVRTWKVEQGKLCDGVS